MWSSVLRKVIWSLRNIVAERKGDVKGVVEKV
jgi:hypothetical protein